MFRYGRVWCDSKKCKRMRLRVERNMKGKVKNNEKTHIRNPYKKKPSEKPYKKEPTEKPDKKKQVENPYKKKPETEEDMSFSEETDEHEDETTEYSMETKENKKVFL